MVFIHFGINTFTGKEWGNGTDDPSLFNPTDLDCRQWTQVCRDLGAKGLILTAKHHDGFCLWPTATTDYSVRRSPWRSGQGDVLKEVAAACREAGLAFGVYLSAADLHEPTHGLDHDAYNTLFRSQLREVLTNYGEICEVFFDGATPPGRRQKYDYPGYYAVIRELQPNAVISTKGPDVRWVGNEAGMARESEWSVIPLPVRPESFHWPDMTDRDLGSRQKLLNANCLHWYPAEADVSIRPGWFYRPSEDTLVKSLARLREVYYGTVGRNALLLLNLPPDQRGQIPEVDARRVREFGEWIQATFTTNLAASAQVRQIELPDGDSSDSLPSLTDGDPDSFWTSRTANAPLHLEIALSEPVQFNCVMLQEHIPLGQRIETFALDAWMNDLWQEIGQGTSVGNKRLLRMREPTRTAKIRLRVTQSRGVLNLAEIGLFWDAFRAHMVTPDP